MSDLLLRPAGVRLGPAADVLEDAWVLVLDDRVVHCAPAPPEGTPEGVPHLEGGWLSEPLADAHVHLCLGGAFEASARRGIAQLPRQEAVARILDLLEQYRGRGVAAVRDGGAPRGLVLEAAEIAARRPERYAAALPAGEPLFPKGGYGAFLGAGVESIDEARHRLAEVRRAGATHVKIMATGLNSFDEEGTVGPPQFSSDELRSLLTEARQLGLPAMIHANGPLAGLGGATGPDVTLEHGFGLADGDPSALRATCTPWTPTVGAWAELARNPALTAAQREVVRRTDRRHREEIARGRAAGVTILAGSDAGTPGVEHAEGLLRELEHLTGCGLSGQEALAAALRSRHSCERWLGRPLGGLTVGETAGFVWLAEDPSTHLATLREPLGVWLGGRWTSSANGRVL